jgi:hypothetical protein
VNRTTDLYSAYGHFEADAMARVRRRLSRIACLMRKPAGEGSQP